MKNKFLIFSLASFIVLTLTSCVDLDKQKTVTDYAQDFYVERRFKLTVKNEDKINSYYIDNKSFHDIESNVTTFKYLYLDGYMLYKGEELLNENYKLEDDIAEEYINFLNPVSLNDTNYEIVNDTYTLKEEYFVNLYVPFYQEEISSFKVYLEQNSLIYLINDNYEITYEDSEYQIFYYLKTEKDYKNYYQDYKITYKEINEKLNNKEHFGLIITYGDCSSCVRAQPYYYEFFLEYNLSFYNVISTETMTKEEKSSLNKLVKIAYDEQDDKYKNENYPEYPNSFLTPSACRIEGGQFKNVLCGFIPSMRDLLYSMIFN